VLCCALLCPAVLRCAALPPDCDCLLIPTSAPPPPLLLTVKHFNFHWRDMTTPPISLMNHLVSVACRELSAGGKIAVHCHAGYGRTGIAIACIIMAKDHVESSQVVRFIRIRR
jgi:protein tyrosine phosphatase